MGLRLRRVLRQRTARRPRWSRRVRRLANGLVTRLFRGARPQGLLRTCEYLLIARGVLLLRRERWRRHLRERRVAGLAPGGVARRRAALRELRRDVRRPLLPRGHRIHRLVAVGLTNGRNHFSGKNETGVTDYVGCVSRYIRGGGVTDEFGVSCAELAEGSEHRDGRSQAAHRD